MSGSMKTAAAVLFILALTGLSAPAAWGAQATLLTQADIDGMGGPKFQGGVGDYLLRNDRIDIIVLAVGVTPDGVTTDDFGTGSYFTDGIVVSGGNIIDAMSRTGGANDRNDQFQTVIHNVNLVSTNGTIDYRGPEEGFPAPVLISGPTASITVSGHVTASTLPPFPPGLISDLQNPNVTVTTTYSLTDGAPYVYISTTLTNTTASPVQIFTIGDETRYVRDGLLFQPMPDRGSLRPPHFFNPPDLFDSFGLFSYLPLVGLHDSGQANDPVNGICYSFVAPSLATPFHAFASGRRAITLKKIVPLGSPAFGGTIPAAPGPGNTLTYDRRFVVAAGNSAEACADQVMPLLYVPVLGADERATYMGRVVTPTGAPIAGANIFFDNTSPGWPVDADLNALVTNVDNNQDGTTDTTLTADPGLPVPTTQVRTDADGRFTVKLQAVVDPTMMVTVYGGTVKAESRPPVALPPLVVDPGSIGTPTNLGDIVMAGTGTLNVTVTQGSPGQPTPAQIAIFGTGSTDNPDLGDQFQTRRDFGCPAPCLSQREGGPGDAITRSNSGQMAEALRGLPAVNVDVATNGVFSLELAPGIYEVVASRGPEYTIQSTDDLGGDITITEGSTTSVALNIARAFRTRGFVSVDGHVHAAPSNDAGVPLTDRVLSMLGAGVQTIISTDHDQIADYAAQITMLGMDDEITAVIGAEVTAENPVPVSSFTDGMDAFPQTTGHIIGWPLSPIPGNRRGGVPTDEQLVAATVFDRIRGMDSLPLLGRTPDTATLAQWLAAIQAGQPGTPGAALPPDEDIVVWAHPRGTGALGPWNSFGNMGYDPTLGIDMFPNNLANLRSNYHSDYAGADGTDTRGLDFDALEVLSSTRIDWYLLTRGDWFSLLSQGIHRAGLAGSDTHRPVIDGPGYPRFYVACDSLDPHCSEDQLVAGVRGLRVVGTTGPFITFGVLGDGDTSTGHLTPDSRGLYTGIGSMVIATGPDVNLRLEVKAAPWIPVEEIRIFHNGALLQTIDVDSTANDGGLNGPVVRFRDVIPIAGITGDSYFVVEAGNRIMEPSGAPVNPALLTTMRRLTTSDMVSLAFTNPIFVDRDGGGYQPPGLDRGPAPSRDVEIRPRRDQPRRPRAGDRPRELPQRPRGVPRQ